jgi:hypothetical protein
MGKMKKRTNAGLTLLIALCIGFNFMVSLAAKAQAANEVGVAALLPLPGQ